MKKLGLDLDGVVYDFDAGFTPWMQNLGYKFVDLNIYELYKKFPEVKKEEMQKRIREFQSTIEFRNLPLIGGADIGIQKLQKEYDIFIISKRPLNGKPRKYTIERLQQDKFIKDLDHLHLAQKGNKGKFCNALKLDYFVDDYDENLFDVLNDSNTNPILFGKYSEQVNYPKIQSAKNYNELLNILL